MDERKHNQRDPWDDSAYGTGRTDPPRNNGTLVTILLILVICMAGIASALGLLNIRLFQELNRQIQPATTPFSFFEEDQLDAIQEKSDTALATISQDHSSLGITVEELSPFYQRYYRLPQGLYITQVEADSAAEELGLQPGDILLSVDGDPVTTPSSLQSILSGSREGDTLQLIIYRAGKQYSTQFTLGETEHLDK